jgi:hypothetical protein
MEQATAAYLIQGVKCGHFQVLHVAPDLVLAQAHRLITISPELGDQQFVDLRTWFSAGAHLVHLHTHGPGRDTAEKRVVLDQESLGSAA